MKARNFRLARLLLAATALIMVFGAVGCNKTAGSYIASGDAYMLKGDYANAIAEYGRGVQLDPKSEGAYLALADAYVAYGDVSAATTLLESAVDLLGTDGGLDEALLALTGAPQSTDAPAAPSSEPEPTAPAASVAPEPTAASRKEGVGIGEQFPSITLVAPDGSEVSIYDLFEEGKVIYVDIFTTWCGYCRELVPEIKEFISENSDRAQYVFIDIGETVDDMKGYISDFGLDDYAIGLSDSLMIGDYAVNSVPDCFVLDENGVVLDHPAHSVTKAYMEEMLENYGK